MKNQTNAQNDQLKKPSKKQITAEIVSVGTELLLGDTVNTNAAFLGRELAGLGISVYTQQVIGDNPARIKRAYSQAYERGADLVIATGGLGPTEDDISKEIAAEYFDLPMIYHEEIWSAMEKLWQKLAPGQPVASNNKRQAMIPEGATVLANPNGSAPGVYIEKDGKMMILLPGPPHELEPMFFDKVIPILRNMSQTVLVSKILKVAGIGESTLEQKIKDLIENQDNPTIAPYAKTAEVHLRVTASAPTEEKARELIAPVAVELKNILGSAVYGEDDDTLEGVISNLLQKQGFTLACGESCTGGLVAARLINHPGISEVLQGGIIAYANEAKVKLLGVSEELLDQFGAVSPEVAAAMAEGAARSLNASIGLATTGIAGPGGATENKPVGRVYLGLYIPKKGTTTKEMTVTGNRSKIRVRATVAALDFLRLHISD